MTFELYLPGGARSRATDALGLLRRRLRRGADYEDLTAEDVTDVLSKFNSDSSTSAATIQADEQTLDVLWSAASEYRFTFREKKPEVIDAGFERFELVLVDAEERCDT